MDVNLGKTCRQGELLFIPVTNMPKWAKEKAMKGNSIGNVIREGEVSGHKHEVEGAGAKLMDAPPSYMWDSTSQETFQLPDGQMFLTSENEIIVKHPEHNSLKLKKGNYVVRVQREYDEVENRMVMD